MSVAAQIIGLSHFIESSSLYFLTIKTLKILSVSRRVILQCYNVSCIRECFNLTLSVSYFSNGPRTRQICPAAAMHQQKEVFINYNECRTKVSNKKTMKTMEQTKQK